MKKILVHGAMKYKCENCGREWWMFVEKGLEEFGEDHKPTPFAITCPCCRNGFAKDVSGICKIPMPPIDNKYADLPEGESYFANEPDKDCGVPVYGDKLLEEKKKPLFPEGRFA